MVERRGSRSRSRKKDTFRVGYFVLLAALITVVLTASLFIEDLGGEDEEIEEVPAPSEHSEVPVLDVEQQHVPLPVHPLPSSTVSSTPSSTPASPASPSPSLTGFIHTSTYSRRSHKNWRAPTAEASHTPYPFKIYIYDRVVPSLNAKLQDKEMCWAPYSSTEAVIPDLVARSNIYTPHAELADFYIVPVMTECYMMNKLRKGVDYVRAVASLNKHFEATLDLIQSEFPYWSRTEGRDHIFIFPSERGANLLTEANLQRIQKAIFIVGTVTTDTKRFNSWKDIVVPPARGRWTPSSDVLPLVMRDGDPAALPRETVLHFRGVLPGQQDRNPWGVRSELWKHIRGQDQMVFEELEEECDRNCTRKEMLQSQFCLIANGGVEGWSLRLYDSVMLGCIPVIVADDIELPYLTTIDYSKFSLKILESKVDQVADMVRHASKTRLTAKQIAVAEAMNHFTYHDKWTEGDAFDLLLKELHLRLRFFRNSPYRFWTNPTPTG